MSIRVYEPTEKKFNNNGIKALHPLFAEITKVINGDYFLEIEDMLANLEYYQKGMIIRVPTPETWGNQPFQCFRCDNPRVENNRVYVKAWHLFYDSKNYVISGALKRSGTCDKAIKEYKNNVNGAGDCPFSDSKIATISSNIDTEADTEIEDITLYDAFEYLRTVYLGHLVRDNFNVAINRSIGEGRGVVLAYNKNITDMKVEENWDDVCTKILPYTMVGDEKITLSTTAYASTFVKLSDIGADNPYDIPFTKIVEFKNEFQFGDTPTLENYNEARSWLFEEAKNYLASSAHRVPRVHYKVSAVMNNVSDVGDTVHIKHPKITLDNTYIEATVDSLKYDAIRERYTEIEYGNFRRTIKSILTETSAEAVKGEIAKTTTEIKSYVADTTTGIKSYVADTTTGIIDLLANNKVIYRGEDILIVDTFPKENAQNCFKISDTGISFSSTGINGTFTKVFGVDGTIDLGGAGNVGKLKLYNESGVLSASMDKDGLILYVSGGACLQIGNVLSSGHKLRIRQKAQGSTNWDNWRFIQEEGVVLYDNTASTGSVSVNLNTYINSNDDFKYIEIFYSLFTAGYDGNKNDFYHSVRVYSPLGKRISLLASTIDSSGNIKMGVGVVKFASNSSTKITTLAFETGTNSGIANKTYTSSNMDTASGTQEIFIRKVVGYKV